MATYKDLIKALEIFERYDPSGSLGGADHDVVYGSLTAPSMMTDEDVEALERAGWRWVDGHWEKFV